MSVDKIRKSFTVAQTQRQGDTVSAAELKKIVNEARTDGDGFTAAEKSEIAHQVAAANGNHKMSASAQREYARLQKAHDLRAAPTAQTFITQASRSPHEVGSLLGNPAKVLAGAPLRVEYSQTPTQLGRPDAQFASVTMHYRIDGVRFPPVSVGQTDAQGRFARTPVDVAVPAGASKNIEYWFEARTTAGETLWDSNFGNNFRKPIEALEAATTPAGLRPLTMLPDFGNLASSTAGAGTSVGLGELGSATAGAGRRSNIGQGNVRDVSYFRLDGLGLDLSKVKQVVLEVQGANGGGQVVMNRISRDGMTVPDSQDDVPTRTATREFTAQVPTAELRALAGAGDLPFRMRVETTDGRSLFVTDHGTPVDARDPGMKLTQWALTTDRL